MTNDTITADQLDNILCDLGDRFTRYDLGDTDEVTADADYSGRGMYGDRCLAFYGDFSPVALGAALAAELADDHPEQLERLISAHRVDQLGRGEVHYFPGFGVEG